MEGVQLPVWPHTCPGAIPFPTFLQELTAFANDLIPTLPLPYRGSGDKVQHGYSRLLRGGNVVTMVGGTLSAQVGLLAKLPLQDQLQPGALGPIASSHLLLQQSWSTPLQLSTEMLSVLLLLTVKFD